MFNPFRREKKKDWVNPNDLIPDWKEEADRYRQELIEMKKQHFGLYPYDRRV